MLFLVTDNKTHLPASAKQYYFEDWYFGGKPDTFLLSQDKFLYIVDNMNTCIPCPCGMFSVTIDGKVIELINI